MEYQPTFRLLEERLIAKDYVLATLLGISADEELLELISETCITRAQILKSPSLRALTSCQLLRLVVIRKSLL